MDDLGTVFDRFLEADARLSELAEFRRRLQEARQTDSRRCGNCNHWMKSRDCPRERNVKGFSRGPSMGAPACDQFSLEKWVADLKAKRLADLDRDMEAAGLSRFGADGRG